MVPVPEAVACPGDGGSRARAPAAKGCDGTGRNRTAGRRGSGRSDERAGERQRTGCGGDARGRLRVRRAASATEARELVRDKEEHEERARTGRRARQRSAREKGSARRGRCSQRRRRVLAVGSGRSGEAAPVTDRTAATGLMSGCSTTKRTDAMASGEVVLQAMMMVRGDEVAPVRLAELQAAVVGGGGNGIGTACVGAPPNQIARGGGGILGMVGVG